MRRILITGGSGDLGRPLSALARRNYETSSTYFTNTQIGGGTPIQLDLTDSQETRRLIRDLAPDAIIHTAMSDRSTPDAIVTAARNLLAASQETNTRLVIMSTDMVFDGKTPPYAESDPRTPISDYGKAKAEMEADCLNHSGNIAIVRTSLIYDFDVTNRQIGWMVDKISKSEPVTLFTDEIRNPVYVWNLAEAVLELVEHDYCGLLHFAGALPMSRHDYGCFLLTAMGYEPTNYVQAVQAEQVAPHRPRDLTLNVELAQSILRTRPLSVDEAYSASKAT